MAVAVYMDVHVPLAIVEQLRRRGVDALTAIEDGFDRKLDDEVLERAGHLGHVVFTQDIRFKALAEDRQRQGQSFAGLLFGERSATTEVVQLLGNACLSPTTLAPKDPFRSRGPRWIPWFSLFSEEPHRVTSNDLVGAFGAGPRPEGVGRPAAWLATVPRRCHSVDVFQRGRFLFPCQPLTTPLPKSQLKCIKG